MAQQPLPLSHSRLENARCLFKFLHLYVVDPEYRIKEPKTTWMMFGGLFHDIVDAYHKRLADDPRRRAEPISDLNLMGTVFQEGWANRDKEFVGLGEEYREELYQLCSSMVPLYPVGPEFVASELRLALDHAWQPCDWRAKDVKVRMILDRVDVSGRTVIVRDWKTSWHAETQEEAERNVQMPLYSAGIMAVLPEAEIIDAALVFPRKSIERTVRIEKADLEKARARIDRESARIERARAANQWDPIPGTQCEYCPVFKICPAKETAADFRAPASIDEAKAILGKVALLRKGLGNAMGMLKAWVKNFGPVVAEGLIAEERRQGGVYYPVQDLREELEDLEIDPWTFAKWDGRALKKAAKENPEIKEALELVAQDKKPTTRWFVGKAGQAPDDEDED